MAATKRNGRPYHLRPKFYVYEMSWLDGSCLYVGKGSDWRLGLQRREYGVEGHEIARFWREDDAYAYERVAIVERNPRLNKCSGGNGGRVERKYPIESRDASYKLMAKIGTRAYAARILLRYQHLIAPSNLEAVRAIANEG